MTEHIEAKRGSGSGISWDQLSWRWEYRPAPCTASKWELSKAANREYKLSADNEHLIFGCGQVICFSEQGSFSIVGFLGQPQ